MGTILVVLAAYWLGLKTRRLLRLAKIVYGKRKYGICFRYRRGPREERNGTRSNFCLRCRHPQGYHSWD